ncbi:hypothetical protein ASG19_17355 [Rhizobium sp. Leaf306]|nr:hypothetical protein ASG19_17355 [Rhizobium sp. Leaf306]
MAAPKVRNRYLQLNLDTASDEVRDQVRSKHLLEDGLGWTKLTRSANAGTIPGASRVQTRMVQFEQAPLFGSIMCEGFGFPPTLAELWSAIVGKDGWSCFFALDDRTPVGTGAMYASGTHANTIVPLACPRSLEPAPRTSAVHRLN